MFLCSRGEFSVSTPRICTLREAPLLTRLFPLHTRASLATPLFPLLTQKQGGVPLQKCRRADIFSLFSPHPHSLPSCFSSICALFHFPYPAYLPPFQYLLHSCPKNRGYTPLWSNQFPLERPSVPLLPLLPLLPLPPLSPFTAHSQSCYPTFTHPSPALVTMFPSQGSSSHTMPITIRTRTVHFYRCDPLREIPS
jgi:hypothetical protein